MLVEEIPRKEWASFLEAFGRQHEGWHATAELHNAPGCLITVENRPLRRTEVETDPRGQARITLMFDGGDSETVTSIADNAEHLRFLETDRHEHVGLEIESEKGRKLIVRFRSPTLPEMLNGVLPIREER